MSATLRSLAIAETKKSAKITILPKFVRTKAAEFQDVGEDIPKYASSLNLAIANLRNLANMIIK